MVVLDAAAARCCVCTHELHPCTCTAHRRETGRTLQCCSAAGDAVPGADRAAVCLERQPAQQQVIAWAAQSKMCRCQRQPCQCRCSATALTDISAGVDKAVCDAPVLDSCSYVLKTQALVLTGYGAGCLQNPRDLTCVTWLPANLPPNTAEL